MKCILVSSPGVQEDDFVTLITTQQDSDIWMMLLRSFARISFHFSFARAHKIHFWWNLLFLSWYSIVLIHKVGESLDICNQYTINCSQMPASNRLARQHDTESNARICWPDKQPFSCISDEILLLPHLHSLFDLLLVARMFVLFLCCCQKKCMRPPLLCT